MRIGWIVLTIVLLSILSTGYVSGAGLGDDVAVTGYIVNGKVPTLVMEQNGGYGFLVFFDNTTTWAFVRLDTDMHITPIRVYHVLEPKGHVVYPTSMIPYKNGFLVAGNIDVGSNSSSSHWGFWLAYFDKSGDVLWERAYLTRFTSSVSRIIVDNSTGKILLIGSGCFYSGSDGFIGVFNPETRKLEKLVALGSIYADGIDDVIVLRDSYIVVGSSWSLGDIQGKPFVVRFTKDFSVLNSVAFTLLDGGTPVKSADWWATYASYSNGTIRLFGKFLVEKYGQKRVTLQKSGLWWMALDDNFDLLNYSFKEATVNSNPIELGYSGVFKLYHLPSPNDSMIVSGVYLDYERFFVGWIHNSSIDGYFVNVNRSPVDYYNSLIPPFTPVFTLDNSLVLTLTAQRYSDVNFKAYSPLLAIRIPYTKLHNPLALRKNFLYGGNFSIKLKNAGFRVKESRYVVPYNIKLLNVEIHPGNISIVPVDSTLNIVELRNPKPMVEVDIFQDSDSSFPSDATIYIDGTKINISSPTTTLYLFPGKHNVTITKPGFIPHNETIDLQAFVRYGFDIDVLASFLRLSVSPENATIKIICPPSYRPDYRFTFNITSKIKGIILPTAYHCLVTAVKDGYVPQSKEIWTFNVMNLTFNLTPEPVSLAISSNPPAEVFVNGKSYGRTPKNLSLNPGNYTVVLSKQGYQNYSVNLTLKPGESKSLSVTLTPLEKSTTSSTSTSTPVAHNETSSTTSSTPSQNTRSQPVNEERNVCGPAFMVVLALLALVAGRKRT